MELVGNMSLFPRALACVWSVLLTPVGLGSGSGALWGWGQTWLLCAGGSAEPLCSMGLLRLQEAALCPGNVDVALCTPPGADYYCQGAGGEGCGALEGWARSWCS